MWIGPTLWGEHVADPNRFNRFLRGDPMDFEEEDMYQGRPRIAFPGELVDERLLGWYLMNAWAFFWDVSLLL